MHTNHNNLSDLSKCLKKEFSKYRVVNGDLSYYPDPKLDEDWILARFGHMPISIGDSIRIKERKIFSKTLVTIIRIDPREYERFKSGKRVSEFQGSKRIEEIYPKSTIIYLNDNLGRKIYDLINERMQSEEYDFATIDLTLKK